jgi:ketosteroid isomerase-like protein
MSEGLQIEFEQIEREWAMAIVSNNPESIGFFMADEWVIVGETGVVTKDRFLSLVASGDLTHEAMDGTVKTVRVYGDVAIVIGRGTNNGHFKGQPFSSDEWITDVYIRRDGRWKCVLTHLTPAVDSH